jgi:hypothetical protein
MLQLPESNQLGLVLLLCGNPEHAGITDSLGTQLLEQRIGAASGRDDFTALERHPLALKPSEYLG